ncbi:MAG: hypothetical protein M1453_04645 [Acidobacteria bacterium]|nr:hypothetical protein [Acidobacteriota bacterium]MCL5287269.1 hypothetical protein [Acidobacteriota bacterium]
MAQSYLIFDFGANEQAAQQARHKLEGWKQAFRLGNKIVFKFDREPPEKKNGGEQIRILVKLDFSDHEKLSLHRWLERIPAEEPFKSASLRVQRAGEDGYATTAERFEALA